MIEDIKLIHENLAHSAAKFSERTAFKFNNQELTYRELNLKSQHCAQLLIRKGLQKGDRIGILMNRCLETSVAIYGVLQAGGVYVPIDPNAPLSRIKFLLEDCNIKIILTTSNQSRVYQHLSKEILLLDEEVSEQVDFKCPWQINLDDEAYILYTSGSTGKPKGIVHTHKSGSGFANLCVETFDINEKDRIANHAPIFFDISTLAYFAGPLSGACTVIISDAHTIMVASLADLILREKITVWYSVPLALVQLIDSGRLNKEACSSLRIVFYAGEAFLVNYLRKLMSFLNQTDVVNLYGPTETNVCTYYKIKEIPDDNQIIPIGNIWACTEYVIENEELLIHSITNMKGYWNKNELTEASFVEIEGKPFYRTGDLVELREGQLFLKGRKDHQIKIRGFRVELGDIEHAFLSHFQVKEAVAIPLDKNGKIVDIQIALIADKVIDEATLLNHAQKYLPRYAMPSKIIILEDFPRTRTGKVQRSEIKKLVS